MMDKVLSEFDSDNSPLLARSTFSCGKYETQWHNLMRPCGVTRGKEPIAVIGELGRETVAC